VIDGIDLSGRRAIVTGGSSGIGIETARARCPPRAPRSRSPCATPTPASGPPPTSWPAPATRRAAPLGPKQKPRLPRM
jgi:hypothetical protein